MMNKNQKLIKIKHFIQFIIYEFPTETRKLGTAIKINSLVCY